MGCNLTSKQRARLADDVGRQLAYLNKLLGRMQVHRFPEDDCLVREAERARTALQDLYDAARFMDTK